MAGDTPMWLSNGYNFHLDALKFGSNYYYNKILINTKAIWYSTNDPDIIAKN